MLEQKLRRKSKSKFLWSYVGQKAKAQGEIKMANLKLQHFKRHNQDNEKINIEEKNIFTSHRDICDLPLTI